MDEGKIEKLMGWAVGTALGGMLVVWVVVPALVAFTGYWVASDLGNALMDSGVRENFAKAMAVVVWVWVFFGGRMLLSVKKERRRIGLLALAALALVSFLTLGFIEPRDVPINGDLKAFGAPPQNGSSWRGTKSLMRDIEKQAAEK